MKKAAGSQLDDVVADGHERVAHPRRRNTVIFAAGKLAVERADRFSHVHLDAIIFQEVDCPLNLAAHLGKQVRTGFSHVAAGILHPEFAEFSLCPQAGVVVHERQYPMIG